jgi:hypothetical protein
MKDFRYQVKWSDKEGVHFGIFRGPAKSQKDMSEVDDAVMPYYHVVPTKDLVDVEQGEYVYVKGELGGGFNDEFQKHVDAAYKAADNLSKSLPEGILVGKLFSVGVADGSAWYVVTKVGKTTAKVEWRGFCSDRYSDQVIGMGGTFPLTTLKRMGVGRKSLFA